MQSLIPGINTLPVKKRRGKNRTLSSSAVMMPFTKKGATWFYWIAGLSLVNSLITLSGADWNFSIGLSVTQILDLVANILVQDTSGSIVLLVKAIAFLLDLAIVGVFVLFGWFALRQHHWAMITGMILYSLDGVICMFLGVWISVGLHAFALYNLWGGWSAMRALRRLPQ